MKIGIDISQIVHEGTGVGNYVRRMVMELLKHDTKNEYVLFGASLRRRQVFYQFFQSLHKIPGIEKINSGNLGFKRVRLVVVPIPPVLLDLLWNKLHVAPIEWFTGPLDVFWSSDWTQPPLRYANGVTTIHDLSVYRSSESFVDTNIVEVQKRRLTWAKKECDYFLCDSEATKQDILHILHIPSSKIYVVYPGFSLPGVIL